MCLLRLGAQRNCLRYFLQAKIRPSMSRTYQILLFLESIFEQSGVDESAFDGFSFSPGWPDAFSSDASGYYLQLRMDHPILETYKSYYKVYIVSAWCSS